MFFSIRSQAAIDFVMTYGWAIMMVLVAIGALAYFGVLSPDKFVPKQCNLPPGLACLDFEARSFAPGNSEIDIQIRNSLGFDISNYRVAATGCQEDVTISVIKNGAATTSTNHDCTFVVGDRYVGELNVTYTNAQTGITHIGKGKIVTRVTSTS
mgnify:CR=1 FL=1